MKIVIVCGHSEEGTRNDLCGRAFQCAFFVLIGLAVVLRPAALRATTVSAPVYDLAMVDAHGHLQRKMSAEDFLKLMDVVGVSRVVLMPTLGEGGTDDQALDYARRYPGRFIPFIGFQDGPLATPAELWWNPDRKELAYLGVVEDKLRSGQFYGWGEIVLRYYGHAGGVAAKPEPEIDRPANSPLMFRIADLATRYHTPLNIHAEGEPLVVASMGRLLTQYPDLVVVWAHNCGRQSAVEIRRHLRGHPNLYCDLGGMTNTDGYGSGWPRSMRWTVLVDDPSGQLSAEMKDLFEEYSDRFMVGMDVYFYDAYPRYAPRAMRFRQWFDQLSPETARKLAHENAERLLKLPPLKKQ